MAATAMINNGMRIGIKFALLGRDNLVEIGQLLGCPCVGSVRRLVLIALAFVVEDGGGHGDGDGNEDVDERGCGDEW